MATALSLRCSAHTRPATGHEINGDNHFADASRRLFMVSDGAGETSVASTASRVVVECVSEHLEMAPQGDEAVRRWLVNAFKAAREAVQQESKISHRLRDMSATLTMLHAGEDDTWRILHVGNSRAYLLENGELKQLTADHSLAYEQFRMGNITREELRTHPKLKVLTRAIGGSRSLVVPDIVTGPLHAGQVFVLCSNSLGKALDDCDLEEIVGTDLDPDILAAALVEAAEIGDGDDDVTVVVVCVEEAAS